MLSGEALERKLWWKRWMSTLKSTNLARDGKTNSEQVHIYTIVIEGSRRTTQSILHRGMFFGHVDLASSFL
jgi:hypothetical protein